MKFQTIEEAYMSIYKEDIHDLAKQDPREAYPEKDDMEEFEKETESDLYRDETKEKKTEDECPCGGEDKEECNCH
jgi:hypothetical protein